MKKRECSSAVKHGILAGIASATSIISYPLEVLKIRCHVLEDKQMTRNLIRKMVQNEGVKSFYKGLGQNLLQGFWGYGAVFLFYEYFNTKLNKFNEGYVTVNSIISSTLAGMIAVTITSPFNFIKTRQILFTGGESKSNKSKKSMTIIPVVKQIYKENKSITALWKALNPSLITSFYSAIQISLYQYLKVKFISETNNENLKLNSFFGLVSRCVACTIIFPFALLRSRMLNYSKNSLVGENLKKGEFFYSSNFKYTKVVKDIRDIIKREGVISLFRGLKYELVKVSINGALFFYVYEFLNTKYN